MIIVDAWKFRRWARRMAEIAYGIGYVEQNVQAVLAKMRPGERRTIEPFVMTALRREIACELFTPSFK